MHISYKPKWTDAQITPSPIGKTINNISAINRNGELFSVQFVFGDNTTLTIDGHHNCSLWITHGGQPNDPSSPTAEPNPQSAATALSAVGCSAWLGGGNPSGCSPNNEIVYGRPPWLTYETIMNLNPHDTSCANVKSTKLAS